MRTSSHKPAGVAAHCCDLAKTIALVFIWCGLLSAPSALATEFFFYNPTPSDYVAGYSINLMKKGEVIGFPRAVSQCTEKAGEISSCKTNFCKIRTLLAAWEVCRQKFASDKQDSFKIDSGTGTAPNPPTPLKDPPTSWQPPAGAKECFSTAADLTSKKIMITLSTQLTPEEIANLTSVIDSQLTELRKDGATIAQLPCQTFLAPAAGLPNLSAPQQVRLFALLALSTDAELRVMESLVRLAFDPTLSPRVPRGLWLQCIAQAEFSVLLYRTPISKLLGAPSVLCPTFAYDSVLADKAAADLKDNEP